MKNLLSFVFALLVVSCSTPKKNAHEIIENSIQYHGGSAYDTLDVEYSFRDKNYSLNHNEGQFTYKRIFNDSIGNNILDVLNNEGFYREINGEQVELSAIDSAAYANSVNSVHYFALLPYGLNGSAVISEKLANTLIKGKEYYTIKITFQQEGGGTDFEDKFVYWFNIKDYSMDYMAYSYHTEGGGTRFREAYNSRKINGVVFQDYNNYEADKDATLSNLPGKYEAEQLKLLSKIDLHFNTEK